MPVRLPMCQEEGMECPNEAVGTDIVGTHLCRKHLDFSILVQRLINRQLERMGRSDLIPDKARLEKNN